MPNPTVKEIASARLKADGYDGLFNPDGSCACEIADLMPCDTLASNCEAGYRTPCDGTCEAGGGCNFHIQAEKPKTSAGGDDDFDTDMETP